MLKQNFMDFVNEFSPIATLLAVSTLLFIVFGQGANMGNYVTLLIMGAMSIPSIKTIKSLR